MLFLQAAHFPFQTLSLETEPHDELDHIGFERLLYIVVGSHFESLNRGLDGRIARHDDYEKIGIQHLGSTKNFQTWYIRQLQIQEHKIKLFFSDKLQRGSTFLDTGSIVFFLSENAFQALTNQGLVIHNKDLFHQIHPSRFTP